MSLIGTTDAAAFSNNIGVTNGDATVTKNAADTVVGGDVLSISGVNYIVKTVTSTTSIEGSLAESKSRGISNPGWWVYRTYTDHAGNTRHKAECVAALTVASGTSGDMADDTIAADVASAVTITGQPGNSTSSSGAGTFAVTTSTTGTPGALAYVWQRQKSGTKRWVNVSASLDTGITYADFTTATLAYSGLGSNALDGYNYRVKITSANGTEEVITNGAATLTFGS